MRTRKEKLAMQCNLGAITAAYPPKTSSADGERDRSQSRSLHHRSGSLVFAGFANCLQNHQMWSVAYSLTGANPNGKRTPTAWYGCLSCSDVRYMVSMPWPWLRAFHIRIAQRSVRVVLRRPNPAHCGTALYNLPSRNRAVPAAAAVF